MQDNVVEEQMSLFDMGGLTDDGAMRDPVSGNDVPPGSMASEVRDDVPAMLSEGEYIVPADVVRYYGVRFFEDLRSQAKSGLMDMERDGRIGGEPVPGPGVSVEEELTPEEMAMLAEITGMAQGGMVMDDPRMVQYNMASHAASIPNQPMRGFNEGGLQTVTQEDFMNRGQQAAGFQLPRSIFTPSTPSTPTSSAPTFTPIMLYGPEGIAILATSQEQYNDLIGQGYTTEPQVTPTTAPVESGSDDSGIETPEVTTGGGFSLSDENLEALSSDPLSFGMEALGAELPLGAETRQIAQVGGFLGGVPGIAIGGLAGAAFELDNVAKARAALEVAKSQGLTDTPEYTALEARIETAVANLSGPARFLERLGLGSGTNYAESVTGRTPTTAAGARTSTTRRTATVTPAEQRTAQAPATSRAPTARPDRDSGSTSPGGDSAADVEADDAARSGGSTGGTASVGATGAGAPGLAGSATGAGPGGRDAVGPMAKGGLVARRKKPVAKKK